MDLGFEVADEAIDISEVKDDEMLTNEQLEMLHLPTTEAFDPLNHRMLRSSSSNSVYYTVKVGRSVDRWEGVAQRQICVPSHKFTRPFYLTLTVPCQREAYQH